MSDAKETAALVERIDAILRPVLERAEAHIEALTAANAETERLRWQRDEQDKGILASSALLADNADEIARLRKANAELREATIEECATVADGMRDLMAIALQKIVGDPSQLAEQQREKYEDIRNAVADISDGIRALARKP